MRLRFIAARCASCAAVWGASGWVWDNEPVSEKPVRFGQWLHAQAQRLQNIAQNIAHVETAGYRRAVTTFETARSDQRVEAKRFTDLSPLPVLFDPAHPLADADGYYQGSNVDLILELADAREAQRSYEANLKLFDQARQMSSSALDLLKR